jgi:hypothetical protein
MATPPTPAEFQEEFLEFAGAPSDLVQAKINDAVRRTSERAWGSDWRMGVMYRTADLLAKSPFGRKLRLVNKDGTTAYTADLRTMVRRVALGGRVV